MYQTLGSSSLYHFLEKWTGNLYTMKRFVFLSNVSITIDKINTLATEERCYWRLKKKKSFELEYCNPARYPKPDRTRAWVRVKFLGSVRVSGKKKNSGSGPGMIVKPDPNRQLVTYQLFKIFLLINWYWFLSRCRN